jgi:putative DNA primase/helicase
MDEVDALINARGTEGTEELRGILNSGHTRATGFVIRLVGDSHEPRRFSTFTPIVTAMIGRLPPTLRDRSIPIGMKRKLPTETVEKLRGKHKLANIATLRELAQKVARWASDNRDQIMQSDPEVPQGLDDRAADNWTPLLAIAEAVSGEWASRARAAAQGLSGAEAASESHGTLLLGDLRDLFKLGCAWTLADGKEVKRLSSINICKALAGMEHRPWAEFGKTHDPTTPTRLAHLLRPFGIIPSTIELADKTTAKGYKLEDLKEGFSRYLPEIEVSSRQHVKSVGGEGKPATSQDVSADRADVSENTLKRHGERGFDGLTGEKVGFGSSAGKEDVGDEELA